MYRGLVSFNFYFDGKFYLYKNYLNLDNKALAYFWTLKDKTLVEMFLFVEWTQKMSIYWPVCEEISSEHFFRPKSNFILLVII